MFSTPTHSPEARRTVAPKSSSKAHRLQKFRDHSPQSKHVSAEAVRQTLDDIGVDKNDQHEIEALMSGVPSRTRKIKENTYATIVNLNEKWRRHKEKTAELLKESKNRDMQHREKLTKMQTKLTTTTLENERLKSDITRMETLVNELQGIKHEQSKERQEKEELAADIRKLKAENDAVRAAKHKYQERIKVVENDKGKIEADNAKLRISFRKQENKSVALERELRETKVELEMFEEMLKGLPRLDQTNSDASDIETTSPIAKQIPSASRAVAGGAGAPLFNSTPMNPIKPAGKVSMTTGLLHLAQEHATHEALCQELAAQASAMKERDEEISQMLNSSIE